MLAGSPRYRLSSVCHMYPMSTQRLDLPCSFPQRDSLRSQPIRPVVSISVDKPIEARTSSCTLKKCISLPPLATTGQDRGETNDEFWDRRTRNLKRFADEGSFDDDESCISRAKKKRGGWKSDELSGRGQKLTLGQFRDVNLGFNPSFQVPRSVSLTAALNPAEVSSPLSYVGNNDTTCFVSSDLPLPKISLVDSIVAEAPKLGGQNVETSQGQPVQEALGSSSSSGTGTSAIRLNEVGNVSRSHNPNISAEIFTGKNEEQAEEHEGFELISLLVACIEAIDEKDISRVNHFIAKLGQLASPEGSAVSRVAAYFTEALATRVARMWPLVFHITTPRELNQFDDESGIALRLLNQVSPIPQFIHFTANEILLREFEGMDRIHIIDFDIKQGLQWPSLFQSLACRSNPPCHVRITGIGESKQELIETGERLAEIAEALHLPFKFHPVVDKLEDVRLWMLHVKERECVAVNCIFQLHKMLYDNSRQVLREFLGLIRSTNPKVVIMAEQEAEHNHQSLNTRLSNSMRYYSAIFDSIDISLPLDSLVRTKIEEMFAREITNIIACEGRDRLERHESFGMWRKSMEEGRFRCIGISDREFLQSRMLLKMYSCDNFRLEKIGLDHDSALTLTWLDQPLYTVSAWSPIDVAGSSSSYSQPS